MLSEITDEILSTIRIKITNKEHHFSHKLQKN